MSTTPKRSSALDDNLAADIREELRKAPPTGQSISFLMSQLRDRGYQLRGSRVDFENEVAALGFTIVHVYKKGGKTVRLTLVQDNEPSLDQIHQSMDRTIALSDLPEWSTNLTVFRQQVGAWKTNCIAVAARDAGQAIATVYANVPEAAHNAMLVASAPAMAKLLERIGAELDALLDRHPTLPQGATLSTIIGDINAVLYPIATAEVRS